MTPEQAKKLREPFPDSVIGKLPKLACKACSDSPQKHCGKHSKTRCAECGNYISRAAAMQAGRLFVQRKEGEAVGQRARTRRKPGKG